ncbi:MAG: metallophosphoesterase, partial [Methanotrichaceae archaeon]|nr:metallophosphoesterase [Methanotrichaceae archaeon]
MSTLRILGMADLHDHAEMLNALNDIDIDLIAFCGDLHNGSDRELAKPVAEALSKLGPPVLIVPGNMDHKDVVSNLWSEVGLINIHGNSYRLGNYGFIGMGGIVVRNPRRIGDPSRYYHIDEDVYESLANSHQDISSLPHRIVITHQPPRNARDTIYTGEKTGSVSLHRFVVEYSPELLLCGHIHEDRGEAQIGSTKVLNVGEMRMGHAAMIEIN